MLKDAADSDAVREHAFRVASSSLERAKQRHGKAPAHRSLRSMAVDPGRLVQALLLPLAFCLSIGWAGPWLLAFWRNCILYWAVLLDLPLEALVDGSGDTLLGLHWVATDSRLDMPGQGAWLVTAVLTAMVFLLSSRLDDQRLPLRYLIRILCFIQMLALLFFLIMPSQFPYGVADHLDDLAQVGYSVSLAVPIMLTLGYYLLDAAYATKVLHTMLILGYFVLMIPHQIVLHAVVLHHFSVLLMPILTICFGGVFDVLIFVALYSWAASTLPARATA
ncbi:MAG: hypothetical protein H7315_09745 [Herminiimonas sp.]|nr:hypothetical protein [Herminiimonas sp.]